MESVCAALGALRVSLEGTMKMPSPGRMRLRRCHASGSLGGRTSFCGVGICCRLWRSGRSTATVDQWPER